jgi:hypothetical protein
MPLLDQIRETKLIELAKTRFESDLSDAELKVLHDSASSEDPPEPDEKAPRPEVRSTFLRWLATDPEAASHIDPKGLRVFGVTLEEVLDLQGCQIITPLNFHGCVMKAGVNLRFAETRDITLQRCTIERWMQASGVDMDGSITLYESRFSAEIRMFGARIKGDLHFHNSKLEVKEGDALSVDGAHIGGSVQLHEGFTSNGTIRLKGARIGGDLDCSGAKLEVIEGESLSADGIDVGGSIQLIRLRGARIRGVLDCSGAILEVKEGDAISAHRAEIGGGVFLNEGFTSSGKIGLLYSQIGAGLFCSGAKLEVKDGDALSAAGAEIAGSVHLDYGFSSTGSIVLRGARVEGNLVCSSAQLTAKDNALSLDGVQIGGGVFLRDGFVCCGAIRLHGARIEGNLDCSSAKLTAKGNALSLDGTQVGGSVLLWYGFQSEGVIRLPGAKIGADVSIYGAKVTIVVCQNTVVKGDLVWQRIEKSKDTTLNLIGARVKNLRDDTMSWPDEGKLDIDGLVYEELTLHELISDENIKDSHYSEEMPLDAKERIDWIMLQRPERRTEPQSWMQLRDLLERKGDRKGAKYVLFRFRCLQAQGKRWLIARRLAIGFAWLEEAPGRIWRSIACVLLLGSLVFGYAGVHGALAPTDAEAYNAFISGKPMPAVYPTLNPFIYTLENAVPLVKLGQDEKWAPDRRYPGTSWSTNYWFLVWSRWLLILSGWFQATVLAAALADRFRK